MNKTCLLNKNSGEGRSEYEALRHFLISIVSEAIEDVINKLIEEGTIIVKDPKQERKEEQKDELWTIDQFCEVLHVSRPTYHSIVKRGVIHPLKCGQRTLIYKSEVITQLEKGVLGKYKRISNNPGKQR